MISLQRIEVNREYDDRKRKMKRPVSVLGVSIRNSTSFGVFVFFLCQYAIVDSINLLPSGIIFNTIIMLIALEQAALEQRLEKIYPHQPLKTTQENKLLRGPHERVLQIRLTDPLFLINTVRCHEKKHKKEGPSKPTDNVSASPLDAKGPKERKKKELEA